MTHEMILGCCAKGWASFGNIRKERTRTGEENLNAARFEGAAGSRVDQWRSIIVGALALALALVRPRSTFGYSGIGRTRVVA